MDYSADRESALEMIKEFGAEVSFTHYEDSAYDPISGDSTRTESSIDGYGVLLDYKSYQVNDTSIKSGDKRMIFYGDEVSIGDAYGSYNVVDTGEVNPDGSGAIIRYIQLRK